MRPSCGEALQEPADPLDALGVESVDRLVEHEHAGVAEQGVGEREPLAHAERVAADAAVGVLGHADLVEHRRHARDGNARGGRRDPEVVAGGSARVEVGLERRPDGLERPFEVVVGLAVERRGAGGRPHEPEEHPQRRGLAGAVRTEEPGDAPGFDGEAEVVDGGDRAELLGEPRDLDRDAGCHAFSSRRGDSDAVRLAQALGRAPAQPVAARGRHRLTLASEVCPGHPSCGGFVTRRTSRMSLVLIEAERWLRRSLS